MAGETSGPVSGPGDSSSPAQEIERKFIVSRLPDDLDSWPHQDIDQGYLALEPGGAEVRVRRRGDRYFETVKSTGDVARTELEVELTREQFETLWPGTVHRRVSKTRYEIPWDGLTIEVDVYSGDLSGLLVAEVEFESEAASERFRPPAWFGRDVTADKRFKNRRLALDGAPPSA